MLKGKAEREERSVGGLGHIQNISLQVYAMRMHLNLYGEYQPWTTNETVPSTKHKDPICQWWGKMDAVTSSLHSCPPAKKRLLFQTVSHDWFLSPLSPVKLKAAECGRWVSIIPCLGKVCPIGHDHSTEHHIILGEVAGEQLRRPNHW